MKKTFIALSLALMASTAQAAECTSYMEAFHNIAEEKPGTVLQILSGQDAIDYAALIAISVTQRHPGAVMPVKPEQILGAYMILMPKMSNGQYEMARVGVIIDAPDCLSVMVPYRDHLSAIRVTMANRDERSLSKGKPAAVEKDAPNSRDI